MFYKIVPFLSISVNYHVWSMQSIPRSFHKQLQVQDKQDKNEVVLRAKRGKTWEIKVDHQQGYKFKDGWEYFCKYYGLQVGDFLVFKHRGNLVFDVLIFDPTACERKFQRLNTSITNNGIHAPGKKGEYQFKMG